MIGAYRAMAAAVIAIGCGVTAAVEGHAWWSLLLGAGAAFWWDDFLERIKQ